MNSKALYRMGYVILVIAYIVLIASLMDRSIPTLAASEFLWFIGFVTLAFAKRARDGYIFFEGRLSLCR